MPVTYQFSVGDRVRLRSGYCQTGEIVSMVPGTGRTPWYFVRFEDGSEDRFTAEELEPA